MQWQDDTKNEYHKATAGRFLLVVYRVRGSPPGPWRGEVRISNLVVLWLGVESTATIAKAEIETALEELLTEALNELRTN